MELETKNVFGRQGAVVVAVLFGVEIVRKNPLAQIHAETADFWHLTQRALEISQTVQPRTLAHLHLENLAAVEQYFGHVGARFQKGPDGQEGIEFGGVVRDDVTALTSGFQRVFAHVDAFHKTFHAIFAVKDFRLVIVVFGHENHADGTKLEGAVAHILFFRFRGRKKIAWRASFDTCPGSFCLSGRCGANDTGAHRDRNGRHNCCNKL